MTARTYLDDVWQRCGLFPALHAYLSAHASPALQPDELLRAEWAARVSALDLFVHEFVAERLVEIFEGQRNQCPGFAKFHVSGSTLVRIQAAASPADRRTAFELEVRTKLSRLTYQYPDDIADGIRLVSPCKFWREIARDQGAAEADVGATADALKKQLSLIVDRRNKIVHEGDLQPVVPRAPWPINRPDLENVTNFVERLVLSIERVAT